MTTIDNDKLVKIYLKMRAKKAEITRAFEAEKAAIETQMATVEAHLLRFLLDHKSKSTKTETGTFYIEKTVQPRCEDWQAYHEWLMKQGTLDGLEKRVTKSFIMSYMEDNKDALPPGIVVHKEDVVRVRVAS